MAQKSNKSDRKTIKIQTGHIKNGSWLTIDNDEIPCIRCDLNCEYAGEPRIGTFQQIGHKFGWSVMLDICNGVTLEFRELYIDGEQVVFNEKRAI